MSVVVTPCTSLDDLSAALTPIIHYFGARPTAEDIERWSRTIDISRMHAARVDDRIVGGAGAFSFELTVPGGTVPAAGVTVVGVLPTHRRRGILRAMMRAQLDDVRERGEPVAYLWASEETIYRRFGYGMASVSGEIDLPRSANAYARPFEPRGEARMVDEKEALEPFSEIYDAVRRETPGMFARPRVWWEARRLPDPESRRHGGGVMNRVLLTFGGKPAGYALYRFNQRLEGGVSMGSVSVLEAMGTTFEATREIWRLLLDIDWTSRLTAFALPIDHPLFFLLARPRAMRFRLGDALWVRLVDVEKALASRSLGEGAPVVFEVSDEFCPWNAGRYAVGGRGVERTTAAAEIALDVNALGSVYLGGFGFGQLHRAGRIEELRAGAVARADALFPRGRAPWCTEIF